MTSTQLPTSIRSGIGVEFGAVALKNESVFMS
jgi:hypothetical protein